MKQAKYLKKRRLFDLDITRQKKLQLKYSSQEMSRRRPTILIIFEKLFRSAIRSRSEILHFFDKRERIKEKEEGIITAAGTGVFIYYLYQTPENRRDDDNLKKK